MAGQPPPGRAADGRENERTPLLRQANKPQADAAVETEGDGATYVAEDESFGQLTAEVRSLRRRRWISLIASVFLIIVFVVILILSGGTCLSVFIVWLPAPRENFTPASKSRRFQVSTSISLPRPLYFSPCVS